MTYILCTDLDRTLISNGKQLADPRALPALHSLLDTIKLKLVYVSGRDIGLIEQAIEQYQLPVPDFAITDVGSQIYHQRDNTWHKNNDWQSTLQKAWDEKKIAEIKTELAKLDGLRLQEPEKQSEFKTSYYFSTQLDIPSLRQQIEQSVNRSDFSANIIISIDETTDTGLLDIIPKQASKQLAIQFLAKQESFDIDKLVFSGDSGNDLSVFSSHFNAILVNNAEQHIKQLAVKIAEENNLKETIYIAKGDFFGLNGSYCSGILEGLAYYFPELKNTIRNLLTQSETR